MKTAQQNTPVGGYFKKCSVSVMDFSQQILGFADGDRPRESDLNRLVLEAYNHIRKMEYWDRYGGADHMWTFTQPHG